MYPREWDAVDYVKAMAKVRLARRDFYRVNPGAQLFGADVICKFGELQTETDDEFLSSLKLSFRN